MKILGIDHGTRTGYSVFMNGEFSHVGYFQLTHKSYQDKLQEFKLNIQSVLINEKPDIVCLEEPKDRLNAKVSQMLIGFYTIALITAKEMGYEVVECNPKTVKKVVTTNGNADKEMVCKALLDHLKLNSKRYILEVPIIYKSKNKKYEGKIQKYCYDESDATALVYYYLHKEDKK